MLKVAHNFFNIKNWYAVKKTFIASRLTAFVNEIVNTFYLKKIIFYHPGKSSFIIQH